MKIIHFLQRSSGKTLFILLAISFIHSAGNKLASANLPNIFSWLLWVFIYFYLMLYAFEFIRWLLINRISDNTAVNFSLFD